MGRAPCCDKANVKKGPWSPEEDAKLKHYIESNGTGGNWIALPKKAGLKRCGKSCRLRWLNYLRPDIKHGEFSDYEDNIICTLFATIGSRWSIIAAQLPGRTDNDIKNYWNTKLKKKFMNMMVSYNQQRNSSEEYSHHHHQIFSSSANHQSPFQTPSPFTTAAATASVYHPSLSFPLTTTTSFLQTQESFLMQQQQYGGEVSCSSIEGSYNNQNQGVNFGSILGDYNDVNSEGGMEEIKRLIGNGNCSNFLFDENKTEWS